MDINIVTQIKENIRRRYLIVEKPDGFSDNTVPHRFMTEVAAPDEVFIAPNLASIMGADPRMVLSFTDFLKLSGVQVDLDHIAANFDKIKARETTLITVGYGGMTINVLHFMSKLAALTGKTNIFKTLAIHEEDTLTLANAFRIYKDLSKIGTNPEIKPKLSLFTEHNLAGSVALRDSYLRESYKEGLLDRMKTTGKHVVLWGAPDFKTRKWLSDMPFYFLGHGGNDVSIYVRPHIDESLSVETYGTINLNTLFPNLLTVTLAFIEALANDTQAEAGDNSLIFEYKGN